LPLTIRTPRLDELPCLSDLCFRSKAVWGYDEKFMEACRGELSLEPRDLQLTPIAVAECDGKPIGVAQVKVVDDEADLLKLFVEPAALHSGIGKALFVWATDVAKKLGATRLQSMQIPMRLRFTAGWELTISARRRPARYQEGCCRNWR
jgi:GNAT superfamily N-acetyltransferase